jgi:FemAB-related protein (PEP-CTERM system-associated)
MEIAIAQDTDAKRWNEYVNHQAHASPYHLFAWKQSIEYSYHQKSYYLMALDNQNQITGILPTILIKPPLGYATLCSLPYCDRGEALADSPAIVEQLISKANELRQILKAQRYEYRSTKLTTYVLNAQHATLEPQKVRMILELPEKSEVLLAGFKAKLRSQIKKAEKNDLIYEIGNNEYLVSAFYDVFTANMRDLGSPTHSKCWFECISRFYAENCIISIVKSNCIPIGAGLILINGKTATIPWASTLRKYNKLAPNMMLYWSLLKYATDNDCQQFDFGRSSIGEGTFKFKQQWGAKPVALDWKTYPEIINKEVKADNLHQNSSLRQTAEYIWRKLPLTLTIQLGSRVRKYISL